MLKFMVIDLQNQMKKKKKFMKSNDWKNIINGNWIGKKNVHFR